MSRGPGWVQRALLKAVQDTWTDLRPELWLCVTTVEIGNREARRRAAHKLSEAGLIELALAEAPVDSLNALQGYAWRQMLFVRLPAGDATRAYARELRDEFRETQQAMYAAVLNSAEQRRLQAWIAWYQAPTDRADVFDLGPE